MIVHSDSPNPACVIPETLSWCPKASLDTENIGVVERTLKWEAEYTSQFSVCDFNNLLNSEILFSSKWE